MDLSESAAPPEAYPTLSAFFSRPLRPGVRTFPADPRVPVSPVDGIVGACGRIERGTVVQAKGFPYPVAELLGDAVAAPEGAGWAERFEGGSFVTIYLSPRHYHRIHAPIPGRIVAARAIPGRLLPVNLPAVRTVRDLFPRNERLVTLMGSDEMEVAVVAVGATNVGRISVTYDAGWNGGDGRGVTNRRGRREREERRYAEPQPAGFDAPPVVQRGDEIMAFHLGSTVVLLAAPPNGGRVEPASPLREGAEIRLGTPIFETRPR